MTRTTAAACVAAVGVLAAAAAPAAARTTGRESVRITLVTSGTTGTRTVVSSLAVAKGVFTGVGHVVEVANQPGDPENVSRDDLVYPSGRMHIVNTSSPPVFSLDPQTCAYRVTVEQTTRIDGGTRRFRHATGSFTSRGKAWGVAARNADGISSRGTLSY
jgi:hypothetical protein